MRDLLIEPEAQTPRLTEADRILLWRAERLEQAGYDDEATLQLALRADVDLHLAVDLLGRGCPAKTALRILL